MVDWNQIGTALQGFGAGVQGQGVEFAKLQEEKKKRSALVEIANQLQAGQIDRPSALAQIAAITGDASALTGASLPAAVQNYNFREGLPEERRADFDNILRGANYLNVGSGYVDPRTGNFIQKDISPEQQPLFKREQTRQQEIGKGEGARVTEQEDKAIKAESVTNLAQQAETILPKATSGLAGRAFTGAGKLAGVSTDASKADARLKVISAALVSNVPRMEGPQSNFDVELYRQAAGDIANPNIPYEDRLAALETVKELQKKYLGTNGSSGDGNTQQGGGIKFLGFE